MEYKKIAHIVIGYLNWIESRRAHHKDVSFYQQSDVIEALISKVLELAAAEKVTVFHFVKATMLLNDKFDQIKFEMSVANMVDGEVARRYDNDPVFKAKFDRMMEGD